MRNLLAALAFGFLALGCASESNKPAKDASNTDKTDGDGSDTADSDATEGDKEGGGETAKEETGLPTKCAKTSGDLCLPSEKWVQRLCQGDFPSAALALFASATPWKRAYLTHETDGWNASGGGSSNEKLRLDEEVLILRHRKPSGDEGGMQVSGAGNSYDAMRWDGMCVTLEEGEVRFDPPPRPINARIIWTSLEVAIRDALKEDETVRKAYIAYRAECKGVTVGVVSKKCEQLDGELSLIIANYMRGGGSIPTPKKLP